MTNQTPADATSPDGVEWRILNAGEPLFKGDQYRVPNYGPWTEVESQALGVHAGAQWEYRRPTPTLPVSTAIGEGEALPTRAAEDYYYHLVCQCPYCSQVRAKASSPEPDFITFVRLLVKELNFIPTPGDSACRQVASAITRAIQQFKTNGQR